MHCKQLTSNQVCFKTQFRIEQYSRAISVHILEYNSVRIDGNAIFILYIAHYNEFSLYMYACLSIYIIHITMTFIGVHREETVDQREHYDAAKLSLRQGSGVHQVEGCIARLGNAQKPRMSSRQPPQGGESERQSCYTFTGRLKCTHPALPGMGPLKMSWCLALAVCLHHKHLTLIFLWPWVQQLSDNLDFLDAYCDMWGCGLGVIFNKCP